MCHTAQLQLHARGTCYYDSPLGVDHYLKIKISIATGTKHDGYPSVEPNQRICTATATYRSWQTVPRPISSALFAHGLLNLPDGIFHLGRFVVSLSYMRWK
jgi:hypothetical protein